MFRSFFKEGASSKSKDYSNSSTFNSGHGSWALAHATRKISLENVLDEREKENLWQVRPTQFSTPARKTSSLYHPGGSLRFNRLERSTNPLPTTVELSQDFPYLFPGTGNAAAEAGLDNPLKH